MFHKRLGLPFSLIFLGLCFAGTVSAQGDVQAQALLQDVQARFRTDALRSLEQSQTTALLNPDGSVAHEVSTQFIIDFGGERLVELGFFNDEPIRTVYTGGEATVLFPATGVTMQVPEPYGTTLGRPLAFFQEFVPLNHENAVSEGERSYGDLVTGIQVAFTAADSESRLLLGGDGAVLAAVAEVPGRGTVLTIPGKIVDIEGFPVLLKYNTYLLEGDTITPFSEVRLEGVVINGEVDETLFRLE